MLTLSPYGRALLKNFKRRDQGKRRLQAPDSENYRVRQLKSWESSLKLVYCEIPERPVRPDNLNADQMEGLKRKWAEHKWRGQCLLTNPSQIYWHTGTRTTKWKWSISVHWTLSNIITYQYESDFLFWTWCVLRGSWNMVNKFYWSFNTR